MSNWINPAEASVLLLQFPGNPKANRPAPPSVLVFRSSRRLGVKPGGFPAPVRLDPRTVAWRVTDLRALIDRYNGAE